MKGLATLIKLSKRKLDELRRKLGALEGQKAQFEEAIRKIAEELAREIELAGKQPEMSGFFGGFAKRIQQRQEMMHQEIKKIDVEITKTREEISEAFSEQKKYEIAKENAKQNEIARANRVETIEMDEIANIRFVRKTRGEE